MLQQLIIRNYAIIDELSIAPDPHLNIVTGETGAGKSIILGALSLILGERADTSVLINKEEKCVVEAYFDTSNLPAFRKALLAAGVEDDPSCIIRREISPAGKSRAFVNDTPVTLAILQALTAYLIDLQQQWAHLELEDDHFLTDITDAVAGNQQRLVRYRELFVRFREISAQLKEQKEKQTAWQRESDYQQFLYEELEQAAFEEEELEQATLQLKQLTNAERLIRTLQESVQSLSAGNNPVVPELKRISQQLVQISELLPESDALIARLSSVHEELKDIAAELQLLEQKISLDPDKVQQLEERIDTGYRLFKKHGVQSTSELIALQATLKEALQQSLNLEETISRLEKEQEDTESRLRKSAALLSAEREKAAGIISRRVNELLGKVGMPNAVLEVAIQPLTAPGSNGIDRIVFLLDANKSGRFLPVHKAASGGEMSRIMLCIKSMTAAAIQLPTLIFDEVDAGISGEAARQVALLLEQLSQYHQLICITHQPQVAAKGTRHFFVYKQQDKAGHIATQIKILQPEEQVHAIAQMIGGATPGATALQHARELMANG